VLLLVVRQHGLPSSTAVCDDNVEAHTRGKKGRQLHIVINMPKTGITFYNPVFYDLHSDVLPITLHPSLTSGRSLGYFPA